MKSTFSTQAMTLLVTNLIFCDTRLDTLRQPAARQDNSRVHRDMIIWVCRDLQRRSYLPLRRLGEAESGKKPS